MVIVIDANTIAHMLLSLRVHRVWDGWEGKVPSTRKKILYSFPQGVGKLSLNFYEERSMVERGAFVCPGEEYGE
jgi:hypothetical protein